MRYTNFSSYKDLMSYIYGQRELLDLGVITKEETDSLDDGCSFYGYIVGPHYFRLITQDEIGNTLNSKMRQVEFDAFEIPLDYGIDWAEYDYIRVQQEKELEEFIKGGCDFTPHSSGDGHDHPFPETRVLLEEEENRRCIEEQRIRLLYEDARQTIEEIRQENQRLKKENEAYLRSKFQ